MYDGKNDLPPVTRLNTGRDNIIAVKSHDKLGTLTDKDKMLMREVTRHTRVVYRV